jgi:hypothetical protein
MDNSFYLIINFYANFDIRVYKYSTYYRVMKEAGINVSDAAAVWYMQILATTVTMTLPLNPHLRPTIT